MDGHTRVIYEKKRRGALIGVLSLGLAGLALFGMGKFWRGMGNIWRANMFKNFSFAQGNGKGFFKML